MFKKLENTRPFLKMAFEGFAGDGKTFTAVQVAIGLHKLIKSQKPIAIFDTEMASKALIEFFENEGIEVLVNDESRTLASLSASIKWCEEGGADILIIDSITHVWEQFTEAYKKDKKRSALQFQDWGTLKPKWKDEFSTPFVKAKCHIIFTGRAGFEYENEINEESGKREIFKSGIKMKAENETAFEPDLLVLMQKKQDILGEKKVITREATILKDRTTKIDGKTFTNPVFDDFYPAISVLLKGTLKEVHGLTILPDTFEDFDTKYSEQRRKRDTYIAEIEGAFKLMGLGTAQKDKQIVAWILKEVFRVNSIEGLSQKKVSEIETGIEVINKYASDYKEYLDECFTEEKEPQKEKLAGMLKDLLAQYMI